MNIMDQSDFAYSDKLFFFLIGGIIGSAITLLLSPTSGKETRELLTSKLREGKELLDSKLMEGKETVHKGKEILDSKLKEGKEIIHKGKEKVQKRAKEGAEETSAV